MKSRNKTNTRLSREFFGADFQKTETLIMAVYNQNALRLYAEMVIGRVVSDPYQVHKVIIISHIESIGLRNGSENNQS